jgi:hypothetical protein
MSSALLAAAANALVPHGEVFILPARIAVTVKLAVTFPSSELDLAGSKSGRLESIAVAAGWG